MNALISHIDIMPIIYGIIMFIGIAYTFDKLVNFQFLSVAIDVSVFWLVFSLHGHSMTGGFAAMIAALLSSIFLPMIVKRAWFNGK